MLLCEFISQLKKQQHFISFLLNKICLFFCFSKTYDLGVKSLLCVCVYIYIYIYIYILVEGID